MKDIQSENHEHSIFDILNKNDMMLQFISYLRNTGMYNQKK